MKIRRNTASARLTLDEVLSRLATSELVESIALFGSRATGDADSISDYDVLLLVTNPPVRIFQMLTHIGGRMADVVFIETETADRLLTMPGSVAAKSIEGMFLLKMRTAQIVYDASGRLSRVQQLVRGDKPPTDWLLPSTYPDVYAAWFWPNHGLCHMRRMVQSDDPTYLTAFDMMMLSCLSEVCRTYYCVRHLPWQGEKAAIRYLQSHEADYLILLRECIATTDRVRKLSLYEQLIVRALAPVGEIWTPGITAAYLVDPTQHATHIDTALAFWESLLEGESSGDVQADG